MNQECIIEEMSSKGEMTKETMYNVYEMFSTLASCVDKDFKNHFALI
jgi:hypothetical protein